MPIAKFLCPGCGGREVELDHFEKSECGITHVHPDYARALLNDRDNQYVSGAVRVTNGLGCPRRAAIEEHENFAINPLDANAMLTGTAIHSMMEAGGEPGLVEVELAGEVDGVRINGKCDRLRPVNGDRVLIEDWKHVNDFAVRYLLQDGPKPEHRVQLSIYRELAAQSFKPVPTEGRIWYHSSTGGKNALIPMKVELLPIREALDHHPYGCEFTVSELYQQAHDGITGIRDWRELPLAGQSQSFGAKSACSYCSVYNVCSEADTGSPF